MSILTDAQNARREALLALAADRPAHLTYVQAVLAAKEPMDVQIPAGVSDRVADAILDDVHWISAEEPETGRLIQYPNAYALRRRTDARGASQRARTRGSLANLLPDGRAVS